MEKRTKIILVVCIILIILILGYLLYPKYVGFTETHALEGGGEEVLGQYYQCAGITLTEKIDNRTNFRCIGIPYGKITI